MTVATFRSESVVALKQPDFEALIETARRAPARRARICLHGDHSAAIQEMLIAVFSDSTIGPHRQTGNKRKSYHLFQGRMAVHFHAQSGEIEETVHMEPVESGGVFSLRFPANRWVSISVASEVAVYIELIPGPYRAEETQWR
ncbi:MAG: cupin fold metalloprotein, WbuC family [Desulfobacterales bacterium]|nr:cupin fold metalloprotein, WbuC family [Desulfobacterales bacterium]